MPNSEKVPCPFCVPASELEALVKVLDGFVEKFDAMPDGTVFGGGLVNTHFFEASEAIAHAREILKGGKG